MQAVPGPQDWVSRALNVAQILIVPIGSALLVFAWDTWKKVNAVWRFCFGEPDSRGDRGMAGLAEKLDARVGELDRDVDRLYERQKVARPSASERKDR